MREILFRGNRTGDGEWVEGYLTYRYRYDQQSRKDILGPVIDSQQEVTFGNTTGKVICSYQVAPETVCQFTGLTDKNGKKIFEGDMVKSFDLFGRVDGCGIVRWSDLFLSWQMGEHKSMYSHNLATYEIIGNIHDNPELLED